MFGFWFCFIHIHLYMNRNLQSIYVTRDLVILKFEARVQIYVVVLNICCEIQKSGRNVVRFSKINSYEISFWLVLFKNMRNIRFLGVWWHYFAVNLRISETFRRNLWYSVGMLKITKRNQNVRFSFAISGHAWRRLTVKGGSVTGKLTNFGESDATVSTITL